MIVDVDAAVGRRSWGWTRLRAFEGMSGMSAKWPGCRKTREKLAPLHVRTSLDAGAVYAPRMKLKSGKWKSGKVSYFSMHASFSPA